MIYLYISTFGKDVSWIKFPKKIPIEVGSACRDNKSVVKYPVRDDQGKNISCENPYYGELTGLYYIWQNKKFNLDDIIGFAHYNKVLNISYSEVKKYIGNKSLWITSEAGKIGPHKYPQDIKILMKILQKDFPEYFIAWKKLYQSNGASKADKKNCEACQMFFTTSSEFNKYCKFLFNVLESVREEIGDIDRGAYHNRYCAFLGERLLSVYLVANHINAYHVQTVYQGATKMGLFLQRNVKKYKLDFLSNLYLTKKIKSILLGSRKSSYK